MRNGPEEVNLASDLVLLGRPEQFHGLSGPLTAPGLLQATLRQAPTEGAAMRSLRIVALGLPTGRAIADFSDAEVLGFIQGQIQAGRLAGMVVHRALAAPVAAGSRAGASGRGGTGGPQVAPAPETPVAQWTMQQRIAEVLRRTAAKVPGDAANALLGMLTLKNLAILAATAAVAVAANLTPWGWIADAVLAGIAYAIGGLAAIRALCDIVDCFRITTTAKTSADLDRAAEALTKAVLAIGVAALTALLHRMAKRSGGGGADEAAPKRLPRRTENPELFECEAKPASGVAGSSRASSRSTAATARDSAEAAAGTGLPETVFRGDSRAPATIFREGFQPRGTSTDLENYVLSNEASTFVGTSKSESVAVGDFAQPGGGYVYTVDTAGMKGVDVNQAFPTNPFAHEQEIAFPGGIPTERIVGARAIGADGTLGDFIPNPNYFSGQ